MHLQDETSSDRRPKVLLVDDEEPVLRALRRCLREESCEVHSASSGADALALLEEHEFALVVSDLKMPGMNGMDLMRLVQERAPATVKIILTAHGDVSTALEALEEGAVYRFLAKPWDDEDLRATVRLALRYRALLRSNDDLRRQMED